MKRPSFPVRKHLETDARVQSLLHRLEGHTLDKYTAFRTARQCARLLPGKKTSFRDRVAVLKDILLSFTGVELDSVDIRRLTEMAVSADFYIKTGGYRDWVPGTRGVLTPLYVDAVEPSYRGIKRMYNCTYTAHGGRAAGHRWQRLVPGGLLQIVIRSCGGSKWGHYHDVDAGGLWFFAVVKADGKFTSPTCSSSQEKANKGLLRRRKEKCEKGWWDKLCFNCPVGRDRCELSRHAESYNKGMCRNVPGKLGVHEGWLVTEGYCLYCLKHKLVKKADWKDE